MKYIIFMLVGVFGYCALGVAASLDFNIKITNNSDNYVYIVGYSSTKGCDARIENAHPKDLLKAEILLGKSWPVGKSSQRFYVTCTYKSDASEAWMKFYIDRYIDESKEKARYSFQVYDYLGFAPPKVRIIKGNIKASVNNNEVFISIGSN